MLIHCLLFLLLASLLIAAPGLCQNSEANEPVTVTRELNGHSVVLDLSETRWSDNQLYQVTLNSHLKSLQINKMHSWAVHIKDAQGKPVEQAEISVDGGMPQHNHGLPTAPRVTQNLGSGDYLLEGMRFNMGGWWELKLQITADNHSDTVVFNYILPE